MKVCFALLGLLFSCVVLAQTKKCTCFKVLPANAGCAPFTVNVEDCSGSAVNYQYVPTEAPSPKTTHTYLEIGSYSVTQSGNFACSGSLGGYQEETQNVIVKPIPPPVITGTGCAANKAFVIASDPQYDEYIFTNSTGKSVTIGKNSSGIIELGSAPVSVKGNYTGANCGGTGTLTVNGTVYLPDIKITRLEQHENNTATLYYNGIMQEMYEVHLKDGENNYLITDTIPEGKQEYTLTGLDNTKQYCIRFRAFDKCGQYGNFSNEICTVLLKGTAVAEKNNLQWSSAMISARDSLSINGSTILAGSDKSFADTGIICGKEYCYQVKSVTDDNVVSISNKVCLTAISRKKPPVIQEAGSTILDGHTFLDWVAPTSSEVVYSIYSTTNMVNYNLLAATMTDSYTAASGNNTGQSCFRINYTDNCGNTSDNSPPTCPIYLNGEVTDAVTRRLFWKQYIGWPEGVKEYIVEKTNSAGNVYYSVSAGYTLELTDTGLDTLEQTITFRIKAVSNTGKISYSNPWTAVQKGNFSMPNAFTPNGDGLNDIFQAEGLFITDFLMEIWTRNGEGVFQTKNFRTGWDGKINGSNAPADTYMFKVEATDKLGNTYKKSGSLQLIK